MDSIGFEHQDGDLKIRGLPLWLDSARRRPLCFVSHAHADHAGDRPHRTTICTPATAALLRARGCVGKAVELEYGRAYPLSGATLTLLPAGHVLGSAQLLVEKDDLRLVYTGDFRLGNDSFTAGSATTVRCDVMLMECTYGHPRYVFPSREKIIAQLGAFVERCFDASATPLILAYSLGKAQEAIKALEALGYGALAHPAVRRICRVYEQFDVRFPLLAPYGTGPIGRRAVVCPPPKAARASLGDTGPVRTLLLTGWSCAGGGAPWGADEALALSDHCDFKCLVKAARDSGARKIYTHHGPADRFAQFLLAEGLDSEPLVPPAQQRLF